MSKISIEQIEGIEGSTRLGKYAAAGSTSVQLRVVPESIVGRWVVIDAFTTECEIRKVTSSKDRDVSFSGGLSYAHDVPDICMIASRPVANVMMFGATGDGTTDDTAAIQAAIATIAAIGAGTVYFPAGTYIISGPLTIYSFVEYIGEGRGATRIELADSADCDMFVTNNFLDFSVIS